MERYNLAFPLFFLNPLFHAALHCALSYNRSYGSNLEKEKWHMYGDERGRGKVVGRQEREMEGVVVSL